MSDGPPPAGENLTNPADSCQVKRSGSAALVALALAGGATVAAAARKGQVSERTVYRWLRLPKFKARLEQYREQLVGEATGRVSRHMSAAADALGGLVKKSKSELVRLKAAQALLDAGPKLRLSEQLEREVELLRAAVEEMNGTTHGRFTQ